MQKLGLCLTVLLLAASLINSASADTLPPMPDHKPAMKPVQALVTNDAALYRNIFTAQDKGDLFAANDDIKKLKDKRLMGYVLFQRYMHPAYKTSYEELGAWLKNYSDLPGADKMYKMALRRGPEKGLTKPGTNIEKIKVTAPPVFQGRIYKSPAQRNGDQVHQIEVMQDAVQKLLSKGDPDGAVAFVKADPAFAMLDTVERDLLKADISAGYLSNGDHEKAYSLAAKCAARSGLHVPVAGWVAGLSAWRIGEYETAARFFEIPGRSPYSTGWMAASGAFWAARSYNQIGQAETVSTWLKKAAAHPRTFYGLIATRTLGRDFVFNWNVPNFTETSYNRLATTRAGARAMALVSAGRGDWAEEELLRMDPKDDMSLRESMISYANYANLPGLAIRLGNAGTDNDGAYYDGALYPTGPWKPKAGSKIDPALIYAIARQESKFNPKAASSDGAQGLMQIMPETAKTILGDEELDQSRLSDPEYSMELGQRYLAKLLEEKNIDGDLFALLIAYNAGPGNLTRWQAAMSDITDPLQFIESIPRPQTRAYVEQVLSNYWLYNLREGLPVASLDAVAAGKKPIYAMAATPRTIEVAHK